MLKKGSIKASDYRVIYQSEVIPRLTIGYVYNLEPALAEKVTAAALELQKRRGRQRGIDRRADAFLPDRLQEGF